MLKHRQHKPLPTEEYKFVVPDIEKFQLDNGLTVLLVERPNLPIVRMNLMTGCGSKLDPVGKKGLSNLFAMSIDEGAGNYDALQLSNEFDIIGSDFDIHSTNDNTYFLSRLLKENIDRTFELFSTILLKPHFDDKACEKEKRKVITRMLQTKDDPDEIAGNVFESLMFNHTHPYAFPVIGKEEDIENITSADIKNFYANYLVPSDSHLIIAGDIKRKEAERLALKNFSLWESRNLNGKMSIPLKQSSPGVYFVDKPGSVQSEIRIGHLTEKRNSQNYFPRLLLNLILGGQFSSRINLNLRENKGYTYGAFSSFNFLIDEGYFFVSTSVGQENTYNAVKEIRKELENIKSGVTEEELTFSKTSLMRKFPSNFETNGQVASSISRMIMYNLPDDHFKNYLDIIHQISKENVNNAAAEYIKTDDLITLIVGSRDIIIEQFKNEDSLTELDIHGNRVS
jgi:zinc protease